MQRRDRECAAGAVAGWLLVAAAATSGVVLVGTGLVLTLVHPTGSSASPVTASAPALQAQPDPAVPIGPATTAVSRPGASPVSAGPVSGDPRDVLAARAMPQHADSAGRPGPLSTRDPGVIVLPVCPDVGPAGVVTGCPHTPEGAMAQLAAIDAAAIGSGTLPGVRAVIAAWALPGGPTTSSWSGVRLMAALLDRFTGLGVDQVSLALTPRMGLVKGVVGDDFVVPCVDFVWTVTVTATTRVAIADCERMVWTGGRWRIGPGPEPFQPPSDWPDTDTAINDGYKDLTHA